MREKTNKQANQVESFWREIGNWCRSVLSALTRFVSPHHTEINIKQQCWNEEENRKDKLPSSCH